MAASRRAAVAGVAGMLLVCLAAATWLLVHHARSDGGDCATVNDMLTFSTQQDQRLNQLTLDNQNDPAVVIAAYRERADRMRAYADAVTEPELREKARNLADLDAAIVEQWRQTVAQPASPGADPAKTRADEKRFMTAYRRYNTDHGHVVTSLLATCRRES